MIFSVLPLVLAWPRETAVCPGWMRGWTAMLAPGAAGGGARVLLEAASRPTAQCMQGLGYKELLPVVMGQGACRWTEAACADSIAHPRHYAKRQGTWFRAETRRVRLAARRGGHAPL